MKPFFIEGHSQYFNYLVRVISGDLKWNNFRMFGWHNFLFNENEKDNCRAAQIRLNHILHISPVLFCSVFTFLFGFISHVGYTSLGRLSFLGRNKETKRQRQKNIRKDNSTCKVTVKQRQKERRSIKKEMSDVETNSFSFFIFFAVWNVDNFPPLKLLFLKIWTIFYWRPQLIYQLVFLLSSLFISLSLSLCHL